jgi:hypothetical protein
MIQASVAEVDRTKRVYFSEESDALEVATKAQVGVHILYCMWVRRSSGGCGVAQESSA